MMKFVHIIDIKKWKVHFNEVIILFILIDVFTDVHYW